MTFINRGYRTQSPILAPNDNEPFPLRRVLLCAAAEIAVFGWQPTTKPSYEPEATKNRVYRYLAENEEIRREMNRTVLTVAKEKGIDLFAPEFAANVDAAIEWAKHLTDTNGYHERLRTLAQNERVNRRDFGWACTLLNGYASDKKNAGQSMSQYIGKEGDTLKALRVVVTDTRDYPQFGKWLIKGRVVGTDNIVGWWHVHQGIIGGIVVGDQYRVSGRVKSHKEFRGVKETQLHYIQIVRA